jgi:hypothetical protein
MKRGVLAAAPENTTDLHSEPLCIGLVYIDYACSTYLESLRQELEGSGGLLKILSASSP